VTELADGGIAVDVPDGWDAHIRAAGQGRVASHQADPAGTGVVLHAASFALPAERGDYGSGAVGLMGGSDVLVCLLEHEREVAGTPLFDRPRVSRLHLGMFSPQSMQRAVAGMAGTQHFFSEAGRAFCLYVVIGSYRTGGPLVRAADRVAASIRISR